ncbi:MAG: dipeptide ABC transporter ATP-binding protein [Pseudomonadota bacterium]
MKPLLSIRDLKVSFPIRRAIVKAVDGVSYDVYPGETLALVGASGSGKTVSQQAYLGLLPPLCQAKVSGQALFKDQDLLKISGKELLKIRGDKITIIFQEPMTSLNPCLNIGSQLIEPLVVHRKMRKKEAQKIAMASLDRVGILESGLALKNYPHELSGGMRQRVLIAMALLTKPELLIADEPTSSLDATNRVQILELLKSIQKENKMAMILISHDLQLVASAASRVIEMKEGKAVETASVENVLFRPQLNLKRRSSLVAPVLSAKNLTVQYSRRKTGHLRAVDRVSLNLYPGEILGLVGDSGCGKSSLGKALLRLREPTGGSLTILGEDFLSLRGKKLRQFRKNIQMVFQDPYASLNPKMKISDALAEPLRAHWVMTPKEIQMKVFKALEQVGLKAEDSCKYPHGFSGGERQRIAIARALILEPKILIADEPVSSLDVSVQAQVVKLLKDIQKDLGLSMLFISHDLGLVKSISDRIAVMRLGKIEEDSGSV